LQQVFKNHIPYFFILSISIAGPSAGAQTSDFSNDLVAEQADLLMENNELYNWVLTLAVFLGLSVILWLWTFVSLSRKLRAADKQILGLPTGVKAESERALEQELEKLKTVLNKNRAKLTKHEVQNKELMAYIEELKASNGDNETKHKSVEIQRILRENKNEDIVSKVEGAAKSLYPKLVTKIQSRYPDLNQLELQYCMMMALGYNMDEVKSVLGRTEKAIKSLRYRIRKKMDLKEEESLQEHIQGLNIKVPEKQ